MIINYQTSQTWSVRGKCRKCGSEYLRLRQTITPGYVDVTESGIGQFHLNTAYEWSCGGCNETGPASNIDNS